MSSLQNSPQPIFSPADGQAVQLTPTVSHFSGTLATPKGSTISDDKTFRRYAAGVQTTARIGGNTDISNRKIVYEVGRAAKSIKDALSGRSDSTLTIESSYPTGSILAADFEGFTKKFSNFSASFAVTNLAGVVERLASTLATVSVFPNVSTNHMRHGNAFKLIALGVRDVPISAADDTVFIPRLIDNVIAPDTFAAIASAVCGEGSQIATDVVALDSNTNTPIIREVEGAALAKACVDALRILGSNFSAADVGDLFAYAVTRGIHRVVSVVGHTDEGGVIRAVLRKSAFSAPFGGIHYGLAPYVGLPALASTSSASIACYVDAIALKTAALVAHCDPGVQLNGAWFPTVVASSHKADEKLPGETQDGTDSDSASNFLGLMSSMGDFAEIYTRALAKLFLFGSSSGLAALHMQAAAGCLGNTERHLKYSSVSPYYWIEPTSLIPRNFAGSVCEAEGFASYASVSTPTTLPGFEEIYAYGQGSTSMSGYVIKFRGARASPFLAHWNGNALNGLGSIQVRQLDPNAVVHPGKDTDNEQVRARVESSQPLSKFLWTRGQSPFAAPGEFLNIAKTMGIMALHNTVDDEGDMKMSHIPQSFEFLDTTVTFHVSRPSGIKSGGSNTGTSTCARARTRATRELAAAALRSQMFGRVDVIDMPVLTSAPPLPCENRRVQSTPDPQGSLGPSDDRAIVSSAPHVGSGPLAHNPVPATPTGHLSAHRAPAANRVVGMIPTSTAAPTIPVAGPTNDETTATPLPTANNGAAAEDTTEDGAGSSA